MDHVIIGVDTHKANHIAVAIDAQGARLGRTTISTTRMGYREWAVEALGVRERSAAPKPSGILEGSYAGRVRGVTPIHDLLAKGHRFWTSCAPKVVSRSWGNLKVA